MANSNPTTEFGLPVLDFMLTANRRYFDLVQNMVETSQTMFDFNRRTVNALTRPLLERSLFLNGAQRSGGYQERPNGHVSEAREQVVVTGEEVINVGINRVAGGATRVRRVVREYPVTRAVELHDETITIERRPVTRAVGEEALTEREFVMIDMREIPVVSKEMKPREELVLRKEVSERTETIRSTVRVSDVEVEQPQRHLTRVGEHVPAVVTEPRAEQQRKDKEKDTDKHHQK